MVNRAAFSSSCRRRRYVGRMAVSNGASGDVGVIIWSHGRRGALIAALGLHRRLRLCYRHGSSDHALRSVSTAACAHPIACHSNAFDSMLKLSLEPADTPRTARAAFVQGDGMRALRALSIACQQRGVGSLVRLLLHILTFNCGCCALVAVAYDGSEDVDTLRRFVSRHGACAPASVTFSQKCGRLAGWHPRRPIFTDLVCVTSMPPGRKRICFRKVSTSTLRKCIGLWVGIEAVGCEWHVLQSCQVHPKDW